MSLFGKDKIALWWHLNDGKPNYGDLLNPYLAEKISKKRVVRKEINRFGIGKVHIAIGSVIAIVRSNCIVWGAGIIRRDDHPGKGIFLAVRGPITRKRLTELGYYCPEIYGDPALLLPRYFNPDIKKKYNLGVIPHYVNYEEVRNAITDKNVKVINLLNENVEEVTREILECENTVSSSLHGLIVSHAYSIPSLWMKFEAPLYGDDVKFQDYFESVGVEYYSPLESKLLESPDALLEKIRSSETTYSIQSDLEGICNRLLEVCPFA